MAIKELIHGCVVSNRNTTFFDLLAPQQCRVSKSDIDDAIFTPPQSASMPDATRSFLIDRLTACMREPGWNSDNTVLLNRVDRTIGQLTIEDDVAWSSIKATCQEVSHTCYWIRECDCKLIDADFFARPRVDLGDGQQCAILNAWREIILP